MRIACDECAMQGTEHCEDCVVTFILENEGGAVVVNADEARALRALGEGGLLPLIRFTPKPDEAEAG